MSTEQPKEEAMALYEFTFEPRISIREFTNLFKAFVNKNDEKRGNFRLHEPCDDPACYGGFGNGFFHGGSTCAGGYAACFQIRGVDFIYVKLVYWGGHRILFYSDETYTWKKLHILVEALKEYLDTEGLVCTVHHL